MFHALYLILLTFREWLFVLFNFKFWFPFFYFYLEYGFFSPYHYVSRQDQDDKLFGYTSIFSMSKVLKLASVRFRETGREPLMFCDLGFGDGRSLLVSAFGFSLESFGMEVNQQFVKKLRFIRHALRAEEMIHIQEADFFSLEAFDYDIIFITWTSFKENTLKRIKELLKNKMEKNSILITATFAFESEYFLLTDELKVYTSWGKSRYFIHRKVK